MKSTSLLSHFEYKLDLCNVKISMSTRIKTNKKSLNLASIGISVLIVNNHFSNVLHNVSQQSLEYKQSLENAILHFFQV